MNKKYSAKFQNNKQLLFYCILITFIWGIIAHGHMFLSTSFSHDSLKEFNGAIYGDVWKIELGRFFAPIFRNITRGTITLPWLIGLLSLLYVGISVFLTVKLFKINSKIIIALVSGIFTVNLTFISITATYIHDLDSYMMSLLMSVAAVFLWQKYEKGFIFGMPLVCISLGLYQCFASVSITLIIMLLIISLLRAETFRSVFTKGLKSLIMLIGGSRYVLYYTKNHFYIFYPHRTRTIQHRSSCLP